jgi:hypothetical protein
MAKISAQDTTFSMSSGGETPTQVEVENITSYDGLSATTSELDATTLASEAMEYRPGLRDYGSFSFDLFPDPSLPGQTNLLEASAAREVRECVLTLPDGQTATFSAFVNGEPGATGAVNAMVTSSASVRITGPVVWA